MNDNTEQRSSMTNEEVAELLGISQSMVSRLRSGSRFPSVRLMTRIEETTRWKLSAQARVFGTIRYSEDLERALGRMVAFRGEEGSQG